MMTGIGFDDEVWKEASQKGAARCVSKTAPLNELLGEVRSVIPSP